MPEIRRRIKKEIQQHNVNLDVTNECYGMQRRILNYDQQTCWLNASLQLLLCGMDYIANIQMNSMLGMELNILHGQHFINPTDLKNMLQEEIDRSSERLERQNILHGQQCARDLLLILSENKENWLDVYHMFHHVTVQTLRCPNCKKETYYRSSDLFRELSCPPDKSRLRSYIEQTFACSEEVDFTCEGCQKKGLFKKSLKLCYEESSKFIIFVITRGISDAINNYNNQVVVTDNCIIEDEENNQHTYEPIAVIEHEGRFTSSRKSQGHYVCDVKNFEDNLWYNTNDETVPKLISRQQITRYGYVILYRRI